MQRRPATTPHSPNINHHHERPSGNRSGNSTNVQQQERSFQRKRQKHRHSLRRCCGFFCLLVIFSLICVYIGFYIAIRYIGGTKKRHSSYLDPHNALFRPKNEQQPAIAIAAAAAGAGGAANVNDSPARHQQLRRKAEAGGTGAVPLLQQQQNVVVTDRELELLRARPSKEQQQQMNNAQQNSKAWLSVQERAQPEQLIDMRQLNYELPFDNPDGGAWKQGWDLQPAPPTDDPLQIFVVPHSHCDPGWIKTFDEYFRQQTSQIITTVVTALVKDPRRTFIWAEISYFAWWWEEQDEGMRAAVRELLRTGQLEFVTGGWVQPDEANSELYAMEIQLQEGHDWILTHVGAEHIPQTGWAIDPFGYSPTAAYLWNKYNFTGMLIQRVHYAVKKELAQRQHLEFFWRQTWDNVTTSSSSSSSRVDPINGQRLAAHDIFTHVMPFFSYDVPHTCGPDPAVCCQFDFARMRSVSPGKKCPWKKQPVTVTAANVKQQAELLLDQYRKKAALYRSNAVLIPLGDDFRYLSSKEAEAQYTNYQQLFDHINEHFSDVRVQFGTLSDYFRTARSTFNGPVPILKGSFFTYSDVDEDYWSGYFTSRVFDKALDRRLERVLYAAESMDGATRLQLQEARRSLSLFQHHDGVTGTARAHVVEDYAQRLYGAIDTVHEWIVRHAGRQLADILEEYATADKNGMAGPCWVSTEPRAATQNVCNESVPVAAYNPLAKEQQCGDTVVPGFHFAEAKLPCEVPGPVTVMSDRSSAKFVFDSLTGRMLKPIKEEWKFWKVKKGGAYLFVPHDQLEYDLVANRVHVEQGGWVVTTSFWNRTIVERTVSDEFGKTAIVLDFIYETNLLQNNQEWFVRFRSDIQNEGFFHTDLNGFNFDTHRFRKDMPIQSQVFPMPTLASIQDRNRRLTVLSEHAQGTASLEDGSVDVWLDRRLAQDDNRGLGQGVLDNRPTRTRLRLVLEQENFNPDIRAEFDITPLVRQMWEELQHPLELFGKYASQFQEFFDPGSKRKAPAPKNGIAREPIYPPQQLLHRNVTCKVYTTDNTVVPFVYMVYKRVDYLKMAIETLRKSDFPRNRVPLVISHDGHIPEVIEYVDTLKDEFDVVQLFHEFSCYDHNGTFPGDDPKLNEGYAGDMYGNPREGWVTCCKHHFTWMLKTLFTMDYFLSKNVNRFLFLEEDYIVAPTIYQAIVNGLNAIHLFESEIKGGFLGVGLTSARKKMRNANPDAWYLYPFTSGPMTLDRMTFNKIREHADAYCGRDGFDEYNWDWTLVHMQSKGFIPHTLLMPVQPLANHIGIEGGMHAHKMSKAAREKLMKIETKFYGTQLIGRAAPAPKKMKQPFGGWGHPADQQHCMDLLALSNAPATTE